ncbi:hypothetical protein F5890DRAFT_1392350, partial [Lentinula detonsa]
DSRHVSAAEQLAIFLYFVRQGGSQQQLMERFQRSADTISRCIHRISNMLVQNPFYSAHIQNPAKNTAQEIGSNPKLYPYFRHAVGTIDGSHIAAH